LKTKIKSIIILYKNLRTDSCSDANQMKAKNQVTTLWMLSQGQLDVLTHNKSLSDVLKNVTFTHH
jgi:hypothetical protein